MNFDGHEDHRPQPKPISGFDILEQLQGVQFLKFGKENDGTIGMKPKEGKNIKTNQVIGRRRVYSLSCHIGDLIYSVTI